MFLLGFPGGLVVKNSPASTGDVGSILAQEGSTCRGVTKPESHSYWACVQHQQKPEDPEPMLCKKRSCSTEKPLDHS